MGERLTEDERALLRVAIANGYHDHTADERTAEVVERILADRLAALTQERDEAWAVVEAVRALHKPSSTYVGPDFCRTCSDLVHEWVPWPCPTGVLLPPTEALGEATTGGAS